MSLLIPETGLLFWMVLVFAIVFFVLAKWGFPVITGMIDRRNAHIAQSLRDAEAASKRLAEIEQEHIRLLEETRREQAQMLKKASDARAKLLAEAREEAQAQSAQLISRAKEEIAAEKEAALAQARREIALLGVSVAEKILRDKLSDADVQRSLMERLADEAARAQEKS